MQLLQTAFFQSFYFPLFFLFLFYSGVNCSALEVTNEQDLTLSWAALSGEVIFPVSAAPRIKQRGCISRLCFSSIVLLGLPSHMHSWFG